jgi:hypothetical protein
MTTKSDRNLHSCNYHCTRPECILAQRNELRDRLAMQKPRLWVLKDNPGISTMREPSEKALWEPLGNIV